jgi:diacylglycerol kinase family enzyme
VNGQRPTLGRRTAAVLAMLLPVAAIGLLVWAFWDADVLALLVAIVLVAFAAAAAFYAVTRRGVRRYAGATVATMALVVLVVVLAIHWHGALVLGGVLAFQLLFPAFARYAIGRDTRSLRTARLAGPPARPARRGVLIINLRSGGGKAERFQLAQEAHERGIEPVTLEPGDDLTELAEAAARAGADALGMAGGDGSQALVAAVAMRHDLPFVCVPAGTRNHLALDLGLDRRDVVGALDGFTDPVERRIDLASVNDRVFVNNASLGVYAKVVQSGQYRDAKLETWTKLLPDMLGPDADPIDLVFTGPDGKRHDDAPLLLISNNRYELSGFAGRGTRPRLDTGMLGIAAALIRNPADAARFVTFETLGQASRFGGVLAWEAPAFEIDSSGPIEIGLDGEALVLDGPLRFRSLPGALRVHLPRHAPGLSPAAAAYGFTRANVAALLRVAAGFSPR